MRVAEKGEDCGVEGGAHDGARERGYVAGKGFLEGEQPGGVVDGLGEREIVSAIREKVGGDFELFEGLLEVLLGGSGELATNKRI